MLHLVNNPQILLPTPLLFCQYLCKLWNSFPSDVANSNSKFSKKYLQIGFIQLLNLMNYFCPLILIFLSCTDDVNLEFASLCKGALYIGTCKPIPLRDKIVSLKIFHQFNHG